MALLRTAGVALARVLGKFLEVRPAPAGRPYSYDWLEVVFFCAILLMGAITSPLNAAGEPNAPLDRWLHEHTGGGVCLYKRVTGIECPGCGLSRGFVQLEHGNLVESLHLNPLTPVVFFLMIVRLARTMTLCFLGREVSNRVPWPLAWKLWGGLAAAFALLGVHRVILRFT